ncbi:MAG: hypothetical protein K2P78_11560 [Gemmataceae bacterium]|nr:hypothetical protein [Gemmataceae bacterium]
MTDDVRRKVWRVYAAVDEAVAVAGPRCDASGRCCRFTEYGHTLFMSHFEAELLLASAPPYVKPVTRDGCPFQVGGRCTAREARPLGCRIYFCDPRYAERMTEITEKAVARLKHIADKYDAGWRYAPLHVFLNEAERPQDVPADTMTPAVPAAARVALPVL